MNEQTLQKMSHMKLTGMYRAFGSLLESHTLQKLTTDELVTMLIQAEWEERENKKLSRLLRNARFRYQACVEEINFEQNRNLDKNQVLRFTDCSFIERCENILITGPTGAGKSYIASALGHQACLKGHKVIYFNAQKLFSNLKISKADGSYAKEVSRIEKQDLFILDDFGMQAFDVNARMALMEIIEDRHGKKSTIISSQLPTNKWYEIIGESTIADAILDRLFNCSHKIELKGESMRKSNNFVKNK